MTIPGDDLIERLLELAASCDDRAAVGEPDDPEGWAALIREAVGEIKRLRAQIASLGSR